MEEDLLPFLSDLVTAAGKITLRYYQTALEVARKSDASPVTTADRESEEFLRREISRAFPQDEILGEEFGASGTRSSGRRWILDPLDATKTFLHGVPLYGVLVGVELGGDLCAGAIAIPALGEIVVAQRGKGCWWNGRRCTVSATPTLSEALLLTTDVANNYRYGHGREWEALSAGARMVRTWGDCYGYVLVATGRADVMVDPIAELWDIAAVKPIIEEAGGKFTDYAGNATIQSRCGIATNGTLHDEVLAIVSRAQAE
ncbi:MAG: inositol monophosphatase family protein [Candidatus Sumerlaeaceae bacterium]|jgi:histidinol phosphatase-like enzyme (inositol monophosphatase family)